MAKEEEIIMAFIVDIVIVVILLLSIYLGYRRGFVKTIFGCLSLVAAIILASMFGSHAGNLIKGTKMFGDVSENIATEISEYFDKTAKEGIENAMSAQVSLESSPLGNVLVRLGIDAQSVEKGYVSALQKGAANVKQEVVDAVSGPVLDCLANAMGTLIVFILSLIALKLLSYLVDGIAKLPLLKTVNKFGGLAAGAVSGIIFVFVLCMITQVILPYIPENPVVYVGMDKDTWLYSFFLSLNPVILLLFS